MKQHYYLKGILLFLCLFAGINTFAYDAEIDGIYYNFSGNNAAVTYKNASYNSYSGNVVIPYSVAYGSKIYTITKIEDAAFYKSVSLISVSIPSSVTYIGTFAFRGCSGLANLYCYAENPPRLGSDVFDNSHYKNTTLYVSLYVMNTYKTTEPWSKFSKIESLGMLNKFYLNYIIDGEMYVSYIKEYLEPITPEPEPQKEGYVFSGWSEIPTTMPAHDVSVTGSFIPYNFKLTYIVDGVEYKTISVPCGSFVTPEPAPLKEGHTFSGWNGLPTTMPAHDVEVTGTFSINSYNLTYILDGEVYKTSSVVYGTTITPEAFPPAREGYTFSGWSEIPETMPAHDVTVYGSFTINKYKLTYIVDGEVYKTYEIDYAASITPEAYPIKEGHTFSGWSWIPLNMPAQDVTVTGSFSINTYTLTYLLDGEIYKTFPMVYGTAITPEAVPPIKEGHTFSGWSEIPATMPAHNVTITGQYIVNTHTLTYKVNGITYKTYQVNYHQRITPEPAPVSEGYTFSGWSEIPELMPDHDVEVTGTMIINSYTLTYLVDGEVYKTSTIVYGVPLTLEAEPTKVGYTFSGWSELPETMPAHDVTVTGSFIIHTHTLTYFVDGAVYKTYILNYHQAITPEPAPVVEGYTFSGWSEIPELMPDNDVEVTGTLTINSYTLTYKVGGEVYKTSTVVYGTALIPEAAPTKEGYTFSGWSGLPETMPAHDVIVTGNFIIHSHTLTYFVNGEVYKTYTLNYNQTIIPEPYPIMEGYTFSGWSEIPELMPDNDVEVTGTLTINSYTITYLVDGEVYKTVPVVYGTTVTPEAEPTKEGHTFSGWSEIPTTMPAHDVEVIGSFSVNSYTLTYKVDGEVYKTLSVLYGTVLIPEAEPTKEGYTFSGWSGLPETMPAHDVTVSGSFTINKYKLTYKVDGAVYKSYEIEYASAITPEAAPTKEGHTFSGWSEIPTIMPAHDVEVTGSFSVNSYTLTYMVDGKVYNTSSVVYGTPIIPEAAPTKEGYTFSGWSEIPATMPAHDVTVSGSFTINKYKLTYKVDGAVYKTYEIEYASIITPEAAPTKEGHTFSGWSEIPATMPAHDVEVTGSFSVNSYFLFYVLDGAIYKTYSIQYGAAITPEEVPTKEGYTFGGWSEIPATMPAHDVTIQGRYNINSHTLTYKVDGAVYKTYILEYHATITPEPAPTKEGYTFTGWSEIPELMPDNDVVVEGSFAINSYTLTYLVDDEVYKTSSVVYGTALTPETAPTKEGYTFSGWSEIPETMPAHDVEVTGSFSVNSYTLIYKLDGKDYMTFSVDYGTVLTPLAAPVRKGMTFMGWGDVPATMPAHDVILTGSYSWSEETINDVTYQVSDTLNNYASVISIGGTSGEITILPAVLIGGDVYDVNSIAEDVLPRTATVYTSFSKILFWLWANGYEDIREMESGRALSAPEPTLVATNASSLRWSYTNEYSELSETVIVSGTPIEKGENGYEIVLTGLDPDNLYEGIVSLTLTFEEASFTKSYSYRTEPLTLTTQQPKVISEGNIIVGAKSNLDDEETNIGFEWRRIDWPDDFVSNSGTAYLYEGTMEGYIRNLYTGAFWRYRPYYESNEGNRYYGDWVGIDPTNTGYFEPTVHTYSTINVTGNKAEVKGYAMRGTDKITSQGFMYWKNISSYSLRKKGASIPAGATIVEATGNVMTAVFEGLDYETEYCYVAFVKTEENEMFYGEVQTFCTNADPDGIEEVHSSESIVHSDNEWYDLNGRKLNKPQRGINIIRMSDGTSRKVLIK